jgi:hypothetical protein
LTAISGPTYALGTDPFRWSKGDQSMRNRVQILFMFVLLAVVFSPISAAETKAVQTMSGILLKLNHFPNEGEKKALQQLVDDKTTTAEERVVAQAMLNLQHKATAEDKTKLEALVKDAKAPESVKTLATIVLGLNHAPSDADKEKLKKLSS